MKILLLILSVGWALLPAGLPGPGSFAVSKNQVVLQYPQAVVFHIAASSAAKITRVTLIYGTEGPSCQAGGARQRLEFTPAAEVDLRWTLELKLSGIFPPGTDLWWQWELQDESGASLTTDRQHQVIQDPRHTWNKLEQRGVILQWYVGDAAFGQSLMDSIGTHLDRLADSLGLRAANPIWITIYPSVDEMREVLLHSYEWVGAVAYPAYNSILLPASPGQASLWAVDTLAHEMTHLLVEEKVFNCQGINQPTWLSEGLAMNGEGPISADNRQSVQTALKAGRLPPLRSLERGFSSDSTEARLSYAQSAVVVEYLIQRGGTQKLGLLLASMQSGLLVDEALRKVYGLDTAGLDAEWRTALGYAPAAGGSATPPARTVTAIPTFALWTSVVRASASPTPVPPVFTPTPSPSPSPSPQPTATTAALTSTRAPSPTPEPSPSPTPKPAPALPFCPSSLALPVLLAIAWYCNPRRRPYAPR